VPGSNPGVRSALQLRVPDPKLTRGRVFSGGVAVIADSWYQAKTALDALPIEWTIPPERAAFNTANMRAALADAIFQITGKCFRDLPLRHHDLRWA
jgi:hypothetical protein